MFFLVIAILMCGMISLVVWFAFLWWLMTFSVFSCACWPASWKKMCIQIFCPFLLIFYFDLYELFIYFEYLSFLDNCHLVGCLFVLADSFAVLRLLSSIISHLIIFAFICFALGDRSKKTLLWLCERVLCLCFLLGVLW